jgi:cytosine/adenosine deaminase-related metal-dependent hydrolase
MSRWDRIAPLIVARGRAMRARPVRLPDGNAMSDGTGIHEGARFLFEARQARKRFSPIPMPHAPSSSDDAYATQEAFQRLCAAADGHVGGLQPSLACRRLRAVMSWHWRWTALAR